MKKRSAATVLWFFTGWFVGAFVAFSAGMSPLFAPILGIAAAAFVAGDPRHMIWTSRRPVSNGRAMLPSTQRLHTA
jgi:hypothetical protein